jgi:hypothetical protein
MNPTTFPPTLPMLIYIWSTLSTLINPPSARGTYSAVESPRGVAPSTRPILLPQTPPRQILHNTLRPFVRHLWDFSLAIWQHRNDDTYTTRSNKNDAEKKTNKRKSSTPKSLQPPTTPTPKRTLHPADRLVLFTKFLLQTAC